MAALLALPHHQERRSLPRSCTTKYWVADKAKTRLISDGILLAHTLLKPIQRKNPKPENPETLLELIFDVWVDKLIYAGTKCSRESHAKQLSRGGELTTIVWMIVEHVSTFRIGEKIKPKDRITPLRRPTLPMPMPPPRPPSAYLPWWTTQLPFPPATSPQFPYYYPPEWPTQQPSCPEQPPPPSPPPLVSDLRKRRTTTMNHNFFYIVSTILIKAYM